MMLKDKMCLVRVGGGYEELVKYVHLHAKSEMDKINSMMETTRVGFMDLMKSLLISNKIDEKLLAKIFPMKRESDAQFIYKKSRP